MTEPSVLTGGCLCGGVRYAYSGPLGGDLGTVTRLSLRQLPPGAGLYGGGGAGVGEGVRGGGRRGPDSRVRVLSRQAARLLRRLRITALFAKGWQTRGAAAAARQPGRAAAGVEDRGAHLHRRRAGVDRPPTMRPVTPVSSRGGADYIRCITGIRTASTMTKTMTIDFVSDVVCPWCIIGLNGLEQALDRVGDLVKADIHFQPFELNPDMPPEGQNIREHVAQKYGSTPQQSAASRNMIRDRAAGVGFTMAMKDDSRIYNTFDAHRLLHWAGLMEGEGPTSRRR